MWVLLAQVIITIGDNIMADTIVPTVAINLINTTVTSVGVVVFGIHTGLDYATLLAGVFGGGLALSYSEKSGLLARAGEVISASLFAGYTSPVFGEIAFNKLVKWELLATTSNSQMGIQIAIAAVIGYTAHGLLLPGLRKILSARLRRTANE
jgi:hypothetical protein